ncbi:glycosyltransferase family 1 protein [soil metagenome]
MRLGLDLTPVINGDTGVARYARELHRALTAGHPGVEVRGFAIGRGTETDLPLHRRVRTPLRVIHRTWQHLGWPPAERLVGPVDVVHSIDMVPPPTRRPLLMTVHDVLPLCRPELYGPRYRAIAERHARAAARAAAIVTTCAGTADDISAVTAIPRHRIHVAPPGRRRPGPGGPAVVSGPYVLYVGAITPRKGLHHLAAAMAAPPDAPPLVVAGPDGWEADVVRHAIDDLSSPPRITWLGRVSDASLETLLRHATVLAHPSEAEGFGIPCLEAMGYGVPVVAGDIPPIRELGGDAVVLVAPGDPGAWRAALERVLGDAGLRADMATVGRRRAAPYTWEAMTDRIVEVYRSVL